MVVYSQSKIINSVSKGCVPYILGMIHVKFYNHSSSNLSATKLSFFPTKCIGIMEGSKVKLFRTALPPFLRKSDNFVSEQQSTL